MRANISRGTLPLMLSVLQLQLPSHSRSQPWFLFLTLVSIHSPKLSAASQAWQSLCSETKNLSTHENPPAGGSFPRGSFPRAGQPGALPLCSVSLSSHTTPCMTGYRPGWEQSFSWGHFSSSAVVLPWYCISRMLWEAPVPTQPRQTRQTDRLKASMPFWESFHHTDTHEQFWYRGKYPQ